MSTRNACHHGLRGGRSGSVQMGRWVTMTCASGLALALGGGFLLAGSANGDTTGLSLLGSPPQTVSVSPGFGAAGMSYAVEVPPGRTGLQPNLVLSYSSGSGEPSPYGRGWSLSLPMIRRSTRFGQPSFSWTDTFTLVWNGGANDLLMVVDQSVGGAGMREYRTIIETFKRIRSYTDPSGFTYWEVWDGGGRKYQFGNPGANGGPSQSGDFTWALNRVEDSHGNYMTFDWFINAGTLYPEAIHYAGHVDDAQPTNRVEFGYEGRYDVVLERLGVKPQQSDREMRYRLRRIKTWAGEQAAAVYLFEYTTGGTGEFSSDLCAGTSCGQTSLTCYGGNGPVVNCNNTCNASTGFCQGCSPSCCTAGQCGSTVITCPDGSLRECSRPCNPSFGCGTCTPSCSSGGGGGGGCGSGDSAGPVTTTAGPVPCGFTVQGDPGSGDDMQESTLMTLAPSGTEGAVGSPSVSDLGQSLLASITRYGGTGDLSLPPTSFEYTKNQATTARWVETGGDVPVTFLTKQDTAQERQTFDHGVQIADVNGDALPDLVVGLGYTCAGAPPRKVFLRNGLDGDGWVEAPSGAFQLPADFVVYDCDHGQYDAGLRLVDINGDLRPDLVRSYTYRNNPQQTDVWINNGITWAPSAGWSVPVPFVHIEASGGGGLQSEDLGVRFGDVDGDGYEDLVRSRSSPGLSANVYLNNGVSGWDSVRSAGWAPEASFVHHYNDGESVDTGLRMLDLNGDGMADLIQSVLWDGNPIQHVWLSRGRATNSGNLWEEVTEWEVPQFFTVVNGSNDDSDDLGVRFGDVNGDGRADLVVARRWDDPTQDCTAFGTWGGATCSAVYLQLPGGGWREDAEWSAAMPSDYVFIEHKHDYEDYDDGLRLVDVNGSGTVDFVRALSGWGGGTAWLRNQGRYSELLERTSNGYGGSTRLTYTSAAGAEWRSNLEPVWHSLFFSFPMVSVVTTSDGAAGAGHEYTTSYTYDSAYYHSRSREFRGFSFMKETRTGSPWHVERWLNTEIGRDVAPLAGVPWKSELKNGGQVLYRKELSFNRTHSGPTHLHYVTRTVETYTDIPGPTRVVTTDYGTQIAGAGDPFIESSRVRRYGLSAAEDIDSVVDYLNDPNRWWIGVVKRRYTADFHVDQFAPLTQQWLYYDQLPWGQVGITGDLTSAETWSGVATDGRGASANRVSNTLYDAYGNVTRATDPAGHFTTIDYDVTTHTFPASIEAETNDGLGPVVHARTFTYDSRFGVLTLETSADGDREYEYDALGRVTKFRNPQDTPSLPTGCFEYAIGPVGVRTTSYRREESGHGEGCGPTGMLGVSSFFDGLGRLIQRQSEADPGYLVDVSGRSTYDNEGRVASATIPYRASESLYFAATPPPGTAVTGYEYDHLGRTTRITLPGGPAPRYVTNEYIGWTVRTTDPEGIKSETDLDPFGRARVRRNYRRPLEGGGLYSSTSVDYDRLGRLKYVTYPGGLNRIEHGYNGFGEKEWTVDPDVGPTEARWDYYDDGLVHQYTDPSGQITTYTYDTLHRVLTEDHSDGSGARYHYDEPAGRPGGPRPIGHLTSTVGLTSGITQSTQYNLIGLPVRASEVVDETERVVEFEYNAMGRLRKLTYPDGSNLEYTYRADGRPASVSGTNFYYGAFANSASYTAWGALASVRYGNGLQVTNDYDPQALWLNGIRACVACAQPFETTVVNSTYVRDLAGHITSIQDWVDGDHQTFTLDHMYRVKTASAPESYGQLTFDHDVLGNLVLKDNVSFTHAVPGQPHRISGDSNNRAYTYDENGSLKQVTEPGGAYRRYTYDARQQVAAVTDSGTGTSVTNVFGPLGGRVKRTAVDASGTSTSVFVSDLYEESETGTRKHIYFAGQRIAVVETMTGTPGSTVHYLVDDQVGSVQTVTDSTGAVAEKIRYKPYGEVFGIEGNGISLSFGFGGSRTDESVGLADFGARFYEPTLGRFLSTDPMIADPMNTMDQNPFAYARGNPVSYVDVGGFGTDECPGDACVSYGTGQGRSGGSWKISWSGYMDAGGSLGILRSALRGLYYEAKNGWDSVREEISDLGSGDGGGSDGTVKAIPGIGGLSGIPGRTQGPASTGPNGTGNGDSYDWLVGRDGGAAWSDAVRTLRRGEWVRTPQGGRVPPRIADGIRDVEDKVYNSTPDAAANGMHAWHAGTNAYLAQEFGLAGYPIVFLGGVFHELEPGSFSVEEQQGSVNHALDSISDIGANVFGYFVGLLGSNDTAVEDAIRWGNYIPGPGDPAMRGGPRGYNGDPSRAWGGY